MSATQIQLLLRNDFPRKSGGDLVLARQYELALATAGHPARLEALSSQAVQKGAGVAHLFNVDRYFEFAASAEGLVRAGRPYVVSPIHHPTSRVEYFESEVRTGALKIIGRVGRGAFGRERIKHVIRGRSLRSISESLFINPHTALSKALDNSALVIVQAPSEREELERTFGVDVSHKTCWVPNGVACENGPDTTGSRDIDVLVAGRIEERKNQLNIAKALAGTPWNVTFVGADNRRNPSYAKRFHQTVGEHENLRHVPHVSQEELRKMYTRSKVFLSASFFEVVSLAELEAVAFGCRLVSAASGYLRDYVGEFATYLEPNDGPDILRSHVGAALGQGANIDGMEHVRREYSWSGSHRRLVEAYEQAGLLGR